MLFFHNLTWKISAFYKFSEKKKQQQKTNKQNKQQKTSPKYLAEIFAIVIQLLYFNLNYCS